MSMKIKKDDIVIRKGKHSCDIRIVEEANKDGILLVDGIKDLFYESNEFDKFNDEFELLCKKEDRHDAFNQENGGIMNVN